MVTSRPGNSRLFAPGEGESLAAVGRRLGERHRSGRLAAARSAAPDRARQRRLHGPRALIDERREVRAGGRDDRDGPAGAACRDALVEVEERVAASGARDLAVAARARRASARVHGPAERVNRDGPARRTGLLFALTNARALLRSRRSARDADRSAGAAAARLLDPAG